MIPRALKAGTFPLICLCSLFLASHDHVSLPVDGALYTTSGFQIEEREEMKARRLKYRAAQKQLELEKQQLLLGKLDRTGGSGRELARRDSRDGAGAGTRGQPEPGQGGIKTGGALDTVLGSLDKLVELERRISSLEKSNVYDDFRASKQGRAGSTTEVVSRSMERRGSSSRATGGAASRRRNSAGRAALGSRNRRLSFSKQSTEATLDTPSQTYYSVRVRRKPGSTTEDSGSLKRRSGGNVSIKSGLGQRKGVGLSSSRARGGASTFLTQLPDVHRQPKAVDHQGGGGGFRSAVGEKQRIEAKRKLAGDRAEAERIARQDRIIREWMQHKRAAAATGKRQRKSSVLMGGAPATGRHRRRSAGRDRSTNGGVREMHLQEFRDIRAHYAKRTERLRRDLSRRQNGQAGGAFSAGTRTVAVARPKAARAASSAPPRPSRMSRMNPSLQRRREDPRTSAGTAQRGQTRTLEGRGARMRRGGQGSRLAVGGIGLRAARTQRQEPASVGSCNARRRDRSRPQRASAAVTVLLPTVRGAAGRAGSGCGQAGGRPTVGVGSW